MPGKYPPLPHIEQAFSCLAAYRDDSHLSAWQKSGLPATSLEVLTFLWRDQVHSFDDINESLSHRGHPEQVYFDALRELRTRGLIDGSNSNLIITPDGQTFRGQVEADTNHFFFTPWKCSSDNDRQELIHLLNILWDGLQVS